MGTRILIFGGCSPEHEVSILSAKNALSYIKKEDQNEILLLKISKQGKWMIVSSIGPEDKPSIPAFLLPGSRLKADTGSLAKIYKIELAYLFVHGTSCEDGKLQALLELNGVPYTGSGVASSRICMSKASARAKVASVCPSVPFIVSSVCPQKKDFANLNFPLLVKPEASGSSLGLSLLEDPSPVSVAMAFSKAQRYSPKVLFENLVNPCRELECGLLEKEDSVLALEICEVKKSGPFATYDDKYNKGTGHMVCPALIPSSLAQDIKAKAVKIFRLLECSGFARADFLYNSKTGTLFFNEMNTIPGFTATSHYPLMLSSSGISPKEFIRSIQSAALEKARK